MTDNFNLIRPLLNFRSEDDFYFLQILQRKKDHNNGKVNGANQINPTSVGFLFGYVEYFSYI